MHLKEDVDGGDFVVLTEDGKEEEELDEFHFSCFYLCKYY